LTLSYSWRIKFTSGSIRALKKKEPFMALKFDRRNEI
jgi:hypothetical protein